MSDAVNQAKKNIEQRLQAIQDKLDKERKNAELEIELISLLPELGLPEFRVFVHKLYGVEAKFTFQQKDLEWVLATFKPTGTLLSAKGSSYRSFIADNDQAKTDYEKANNVTDWIPVGNYTYHASFLESMHRIYGKIEFYTLLGDHLVEIEIELNHPEMFYYYSKVKHASSKQYVSNTTTKIKPGYQKIQYCGVASGTGNVIIYNTDCEELSDLIDI